MSAFISGFLIGLLLTIGGCLYCDWSIRHYWRKYKYCPTCDRLDCEREHD